MMRDVSGKKPSARVVVVDVATAEGIGPEPEQGQRHTRPLDPGIQALRAGAVAMVVLYHSWPKLVPGGYVGVDVFFVISGFLITRQLLGEAERSGTISLRQFWMRRARRLLPASWLVLACAAAATFAWAPPGAWGQYFRELIASALYVQNWVLAADSINYFAVTSKASPVQHFWTLCVEEQFYLVLPLLLLAALVAQRRWPSLDRRVFVPSVLAVAGLGSVAFSLVLTPISPTIAFFSSGTRAWEFAAGALLTFSARRAPGWLAVLGWLAIASAAFTFGADTKMPGAAAFVPVLGAVAVLAAAVNRVEPGRWSGARPVQWLGNISYSVYLWHWPPLVLAPLALRRDLGDTDKAFICAGSVALAWATTRWVENPIRYGRWPRRTPAPWQVAAVSALGMAAIVLTAQLGITLIDRVARASFATAARLSAEGAACFGAQASRWGEPCHNPALSGKLLPDVTMYGHDIVRREDCLVETGSVWRVCGLGPPSGYSERLLEVTRT
jgi:peptidoglycan/LPS O-acetylase OafA/YrhL